MRSAGHPAENTACSRPSLKFICVFRERLPPLISIFDALLRPSAFLLPSSFVLVVLPLSCPLVLLMFMLLFLLPPAIV